VLPEIDAGFARATSQAILYQQAATASTQHLRHTLGQALQWALGILVAGTMLTVLLGLGVSVLLARAFAQAEADQMWQAMYTPGGQQAVAGPFTGEAAGLWPAQRLRP
jgi:hypothetical protein